MYFSLMQKTVKIGMQKRIFVLEFYISHRITLVPLR